MKILNFQFVWLIMLLMITGGCIDEISFDTEFSESQIVVEGSVHNGPGPYTVQIGETQHGENLPVPLSNATIELIDSNDNRVAFHEIEPGKYQTVDESFRGEPGETHHIEIELSNGRTFSSEPEKMSLQSASSTVHLEPGFVPEQTASGRTRDVPVVFVSADTDLPDSDDPLFLKWTVEGLYAFREIQRTGPFAPRANTCFIAENINPQNILLFSGTQSGSGQIRNQSLTEERVVKHKFFIRYYFNVITTSITEQRYRYWQNVDEVINQSGTIFDVPPATVTGNIKSNDQSDMPVLGYFEAVVRDTSREFLSSSDFSFPIFSPCETTNVSDRHPNCGNCLEIENSTLERPSYF